MPEAIGGIFGGLLASDGAGDAADAQRASTDAAIANTDKWATITRNDNLPFLQAGTSAVQRLAMLYGLTPSAGKTRAQLREELLPAYTSAATAPTWVNPQDLGPETTIPGYWTTGQNGSINETALNAEIERLWSQQEAERKAAMADPSFGSAFKPLTQQEVMLDPGYQFGLKEGQTALDRKIAAMGGRVSGAALKAAAQYGNDYATTKYGAAFDRAYGQKSDALNRLAAMAGLGQTAVSQNNSTNQNAGNAITNLISNQGDATGAARLAQGNIWGNTANSIAASFKKTSNPLTNYASAGYGGFWE